MSTSVAAAELIINHSYDSIGLPGIGATIAIALAQAGFGETLLQLVCSLRGKALQERLVPWRDQIRHELTTNESGLFPRKNAAKAKNIPDTWPDMSVMTRYLVPVTSALPAYASFHKPLSWSSPIDIENIVYVLDHYFEFTHQEIMHKQVESRSYAEFSNFAVFSFIQVSKPDF